MPAHLRTTARTASSQWLTKTEAVWQKANTDDALVVGRLSPVASFWRTPKAASRGRYRRQNWAGPRPMILTLGPYGLGTREGGFRASRESLIPGRYVCGFRSQLRIRANPLECVAVPTER
jgi:hypothetical protein